MGKVKVREKSGTPARRLDFLARLNKIYRGKRMKVSGAKLLAQERGRERTFMPTRAS